MLHTGWVPHLHAISRVWPTEVAIAHRTVAKQAWQSVSTTRHRGVPHSMGAGAVFSWRSLKFATIHLVLQFVAMAFRGD